MKKLIIINGVMGVGKTTISKALYKELENCFWLDGDNCWMMSPFTVNDENKSMVINNISYMLNSFIDNTWCKNIVFNWVIHTDEIMDEILYRVNTEAVRTVKITLMCSEENLIQRIQSDIELGIRDEGNIERSLERYKIYENMNTIKIDTTNKSVDEIVKEIKDIKGVTDEDNSLFN